MMKTTSGWFCGTCDSEFDTREEREAHQVSTGHGVRKAQTERTARRQDNLEANQGRTVPTEVGFDRPQTRQGNNGVGTSASVPANVTAPSEKQMGYIKSLLSERAGDPAAETIRTSLNEKAKAGRLSKGDASNAIEALLAIPRKQGQGEPASERQINFLLRLAAERPSWADVENMHADVIRGLSKSDAAAKITEALEVPVGCKDAQVTEQGTAVVLEDGIYRNAQGHIFKVYHTVHGANEQVAKQLMILDTPYTKVVRNKDVTVKAEFEYVGKRGLRGLTPEMRLTLEQAIEFGAVYGVCCSCSATLTDEKSIEAGIGPVCARKFREA